MADKQFPILGKHPIKSAPWWLVEHARAQLNRNHGQTLERLAERGGLDPVELVGALHGLSWSQLRAVKMEPAIKFIERAAANGEEAFKAPDTPEWAKP